MTLPPPIPPPAAPPSAAPCAAGHGQPLTPEHLQQLAAARALGRKLARAVSVAMFDGWSIATLTVTFLLGLMSVPGMLMVGGDGA